ncbi:hypothetical protein DMENIID0001_015650 [Sergentomyia squamirostris]
MWKIKGLCALLGLLIVIIDAQAQSDYCDPKLCPSYNQPQRQHIGCRNNGQFGAECTRDAEIVPMDDRKMNLFLKVHNRLRDRFARGKIKTFKQAAKMPMLKWNDELAKLAEYNVRTCIFEHDQCRSTSACPWAGQNLGYVSSWPKFQDVNFVIKNTTREWFYEYRFASQQNTNNYTTGNVGNEQIGHFTAFIHEKSDKVGCAVSKFTTKDGMKKYLVACNYCYTNMLYESTYTTGKACSKCQNGKCGEIYKGLCDESEVVDPIPDILKKNSRG